MRVKLLWAMRLLGKSPRNRLPRGTKLSQIQVEGPSEYRIAVQGAAPAGAAVPESQFLAAVASAIQAKQSSAPVIGDRK